MPFALLAAISAGSSLLGSAISGSAAQSAAQTQAQAAQQAAQIQQQEFQQTTSNEAPYVYTGTQANALLNWGLGTTGPPTNLPPPGSGISGGSLIAPFNPNNLQSTPGYQFQMSQGLQALLDSVTATGGVGGGNTLKAINQYGQGVAGTTFQQQLADYMAQQSQQFGELSQVAGSGQNAGAQLGALGNQSAATVGNDLTSAAAAKAGGIVGTSNAVTGGIGNVTSNYLLASLLGGGGGSGGGVSGNWSPADLSGLVPIGS